MSNNREIDLITTLAHELGVALELSYEPEELREVWSEAVDALRDARRYMEVKGVVVPDTINKVIELAEQS